MNYTEDMVVADFHTYSYDISKLVLSDPKCQIMTKDSKLGLFLESLTYGAAE